MGEMNILWKKCCINIYGENHELDRNNKKQNKKKLSKKSCQNENIKCSLYQKSIKI